MIFTLSSVVVRLGSIDSRVHQSQAAPRRAENERSNFVLYGRVDVTHMRKIIH